MLNVVLGSKEKKNYLSEIEKKIVLQYLAGHV